MRRQGDAQAPASARKRMGARKGLGAGLLISLFLLFGYAAFAPTWVLDVRIADHGERIFCASLSEEDEIVYSSVNSIFDDPVEEYWKVQPDGAFHVVRVVSSPAVMGYYGITSYSPLSGNLVRADPPGLVYDEIRMLADARGRQRLSLRGNNVVLYQLVPEATVLEIAARRTPRWLGCL